jgi:hypothetical protein
MIVGCLIGFCILFFPTYIIATTRYGDLSNPFISAPPLMIGLFFGFIGIVFGSLFGLMKPKQK